MTKKADKKIKIYSDSKLQKWIIKYNVNEKKKSSRKYI